MKSHIEGVKITPLKVISDERGSVRHMLRCDDKHFEKFGEIYFSTILPNAVKAWHWHERIALNYAVVYGEIELVLFDNRASTGYPFIQRIILNAENEYNLITIPPMVWNGFKLTENATEAIVANCATEPHDPEEMIRISPRALTYHGKPVYDWGEFTHGG